MLLEAVWFRVKLRGERDWMAGILIYFASLPRDKTGFSISSCLNSTLIFFGCSFFFASTESNEKVHFVFNSIAMTAWPITVFADHYGLTAGCKGATSASAEGWVCCLSTSGN